ncbi:iron-sulfur cluster assembly scaffold protein [Candidatus Woesearchaeota archaeon]|jgi:nitrogen fixation protein NifU and related proteins|nr:iron-sulfur cluster assembly scaffold protein [Candidatus Woesearchaeota archaeon]
MLKYSKETLKRFSEPKFAGEMKNPDSVGEEGNMKCGDVMRIYIKVKDDIITDIKFLTYGCVAAIASTDALCETVKGKTLDEAEKLTWKDVVEGLGEVPSIKVHCSVMGIDALKDAIKKYREGIKPVINDEEECCEEMKNIGKIDQ